MNKKYEIKGNFNKTLYGNRIILAPWELKFVKKMYENWASDKEVTRFLSWEPHKSPAETEEIVKSWINALRYNWCILDKTNMEPIGSIDTVKLSEKDLNAEIGYCLSRKYWNNGIMTEALKCVINFLFEEGFCKVTLRHDPENVASGKVMQKAGMTFLCTSPKDACVKGKFKDMNYYYILNPKYNK